MLRRNGPVVKSVESVLSLEGSLWLERFVKEVGLEAGVKERGSYGWWEWWVGRVRRCGRSMHRQLERDRGAEMRLTERTRKLIPETRLGVYRKERSVIRSEEQMASWTRTTTSHSRAGENYYYLAANDLNRHHLHLNSTNNSDLVCIIHYYYYCYYYYK